MNCVEARKLLLEADLAELRETGDSPLSRHVRVCSRCRVVAEQILADELALAEVLDTLEPNTRQRPIGVGELGSERWRSWRVRVLAPLLAAAGIAAVVVMRLGFSGGTATPTLVAPAAHWASAPSVEPPPNRDVVVFATDDPNIVVIWFTEVTQ